MTTTNEGWPFPPKTRQWALDVLGDTETWTGSDWQRAAIHLASAVASLAGDVDKVEWIVRGGEHRFGLIHHITDEQVETTPGCFCPHLPRCCQRGAACCGACADESEYRAETEEQS